MKNFGVGVSYLACISRTALNLDSAGLGQCSTWTVLYLDSPQIGQRCTWTALSLDSILLGKLSTWTGLKLDSPESEKNLAGAKKSCNTVTPTQFENTVAQE